jgi:hypothetical protein
MTKTKIEKFIKKYHLGGLLDEVRWTSDSGVLKLVEMTSDKKFLAMIEMDNFDGFGNAEIVIPDTNKLKGMLNSLSDNVVINLNASDDDKNRIVSLELSDERNGLEYRTGDADHLGARPKGINVPSYDVEIKLTEDFIKNFLTARAGLPDVELFTLVMSKKKNKLEMVLGFSNNLNTDRIILGLDLVEGKDKVKNPISFSAKTLKEILSANSDVKDAVLKVSEQGLATIEFVSEGIKAKYHLIKVEVED